jgi:septal ring factor EnvC (AmiA/AmiB activator)
VIGPEPLKHPAIYLIAFCLLGVTPGPRPAIADGNELDQAEAKSRLDQVSRAISDLSEQLEASRAGQRKEQQRLRQQDLAIQQANREYRALEQQRNAHVSELETLQSRREDYLSNLGQRQARLAEQVRSSYRLGGQSRIKLVLNQDDPAQLSRMLA